MKIKPLGSNILLEKKVDHIESTSGFIVTQDKDTETQRGIIVGVGKDVEELKIGDEVVFANFSGAEIGGFLLIASTDLIGIIEKDGTNKC